ncbi:hypothetical protein [Allomesorhizobium alhagi]|uniref:Uncharacterized protein n=1 Tax=Mesorhizobium alhagi CCNWXJ12-2 TaxID=1107882 RepID=H0I0X0_9HYPH|nr:hypothetical protein [Mesorhizobium alhagi]EHK53389.1 hypothetical protein MAXJ12_30537 [Mesorhizobium alhagi CCNWXJ12-2]
MTNTGTNLFGIALDELGNVLARIDESHIDRSDATAVARLRNLFDCTKMSVSQ